MRDFARYLRTHDLPEAYRDAATIAEALNGLSLRLSRANPLAEALPVVQAHAAAPDPAFTAFSRDLVADAERERAQLALNIPDGAGPQIQTPPRRRHFAQSATIVRVT